MSLSGTDIKILGLSKKEATIFFELGTCVHITATDLAKKIKIPRTTTLFLLHKLQERGLAEKIPVKNHKEWGLTSREELIKKLRKTIRAFEASHNILGGIADNEIGIEVYQGKNNIKQAYRQILQVGVNDRIYAIQGNKSAALSLEKLEKEYFFDLHKQTKDKKVIIEGVISESTLRLFQKLNINELHSHLDRLIIAYIIPDEYINFDMDIIFFGNLLFLINMEKEIVLFIKNEAIVSAFKGMLLLAQSAGRKIDLNSHIKKLIEEKSKTINL
ncbi:hypothetical protein EPN15_01330 [Patescibacteria group bacterium]|nr:MAG: hypothetical protein EPN15_01330 [Patescibacteria group bacterium]